MMGIMLTIAEEDRAFALLSRADLILRLVRFAAESFGHDQFDNGIAFHAAETDECLVSRRRMKFVINLPAPVCTSCSSL